MNWIKETFGTRFFIVGGAGFIGSHFVDFLLSSEGGAGKVSVFDNLSSGREWHFSRHLNDERFEFIRGNVEDTALLTDKMMRHDVVIHLASNPDISKAVSDPTIDFWQGTALTQSVVEAMRNSHPKRILYASGSGVYGEPEKCKMGFVDVKEFIEKSPLRPISTYGASKLAGETLIASYCSMFGLSGCSFRFGNVVGPRQTHGVGFDFTRRLIQDPTRLNILGNGHQSKPYVHVSDVVRAVITAFEKSNERYDVFNVGPGNGISVNQIADIAMECLGLSWYEVSRSYTGGDRGWKGDVPIIKLNTDRIRALGWSPLYSSGEAMKRAIKSMIPDFKARRM